MLSHSKQIFREKMIQRKWILCVISLAFFLAGTAFWTTRDGGAELTYLPETGFSQTILIQNPDAINIHAYLVFPSGEAANPYAEGLAHYTEHLAYLSAHGTKSAGLTRHSNAATNAFATWYWQSSSKDDLASSFEVLFKTAEPIELDDTFAREERNIVLREYELRLAERPLADVNREFYRQLYDGSPLARSVIGTPDKIVAFSLDDAMALHAQSHRLSQATLLVYGDLSRRALMRTLNEITLYQPNTPETALVDLTFKELEEDRDDKTAILPQVVEPIFYYGKLIKTPDCGSPARCRMLIDLTANILDSTLDGGLAGPLRYDAFIARSYLFYINTLASNYVEIVFTAHPDTGIELERLKDVFETTLRQTLEGDFPEESFNRAYARLQADLDNIKNPARHNRELVLSQLTLREEIYTLSDIKTALEAITYDDMKTFMGDLAGPGRVLTRSILTEG